MEVVKIIKIGTNIQEYYIQNSITNQIAKKSSTSIPIPPSDSSTSSTICFSTIGTLISYGLVLIAIISVIAAFITYIITRKRIHDNKNDKEMVKKIKKDGNKKIGIYVILTYVLGMLAMVIDVTSHTFHKPIIYLYPTKDKQKIKVKLGKPNYLICTYPKYKDEWNVIANKNGDLIDEETGKKYYALYWEGKNDSKIQFNEGFVVKGEESVKFLEEKLEILGLNEREAEEFIVYWLPILEKNKYNLIRFQTKEEIERGMELEITPKPDTLIRVMMTFKPLKKEIEIPEQKLEKVERVGYTVVEWGGILQ